MRIGLVYDCVYPFTLGGVEHRNAQLAVHLANVTLYGLEYWKRDPARKLPAVGYASVGTARDLHASGKRRIADSLATALGTLRALLSSKCDVWDVANIAVLPVIAARVAATLRGKALVVTWHEFFGDEWLNYLGPRLGPLARWLERLALRCSPLAIAVSPQTRDRLLAFGYPQGRLRYIPNGIDVEAIAAVAPGTVAPGSPMRIVFAGRLAPHKRVELALRAIARLKESHDVSFHIVGEGPERASLAALTCDLNLQDCVTFHGFLPNDSDVFAVMKASRVALLPSAREGFGLAAVQAWACGLPVVVCDDPENATAGLLTDPRLGSVVPAAPEALAAACAKWLNDPGDAAIRTAHAREHYGLERMIAAVRAVYVEAFNGSQQGESSESRQDPPARTTARRQQAVDPVSANPQRPPLDVVP
jgi:glycosyltransferase involved in cell wall biosynthesis